MNNLEREATNIRTTHGKWTLVCYPLDDPKTPTIALVRGDVAGRTNVTVRIQSECFTGHVFGTLSCDCKAQLDVSLETICQAETGVLIYLRQEGRNIGLLSKVRSYNLQAEGLDTVDANLQLGYGEDDRVYTDAASILSDLGIISIKLLTNNPKKTDDLVENGIRVETVIPLPTFVREENRRYLSTKRDRLGHSLDLPDQLPSLG